MQSSFRTLLLVVALGLLLAGCQSTTLRSIWYDDTFKGGPIQRILVVGVADTTGNQRIFEEGFAQELNAVGIQGLPSFQYIENPATTTEVAFDAGISKSAASAILVVRLLGIDTRTQVTSTRVRSRSGSALGPGGSWSRGWGPGWYSVPDVRQFRVAVIEATLYDNATHEPLWTATTETIRPTDMAGQTPGFARQVIRDLTARGFISPTR
jgi:hypothetical protein